jgi:hypothetical protein
MGIVRFGAPRELVLWLRDCFGCRTFVETGTNKGETAVWAADNFDQVFTIEAYEPLYREAVETFGNRANIRFLEGDSRHHIRSILGSLAEPAVFWLDAHWCGEYTFGRSDECPLVGELEALNASKVQHVVLIDDARLFLAPPPAPHDASHWPDIAEICHLMTAHSTRRYIAVHDDVIICVADSGRGKVIEFLRNEMANSRITRQPRPERAQSLSDRIRSRIGI